MRDGFPFDNQQHESARFEHPDLGIGRLRQRDRVSDREILVCGEDLFGARPELAALIEGWSMSKGVTRLELPVAFFLKRPVKEVNQWAVEFCKDF